MRRTSRLCLCLLAAVTLSAGRAGAGDLKNPPRVRSLESTTSPFEPPEADDRNFVINSGTGLDTPCTFRSGGPLVIQIPVTRYAGPTNPDGTLVHWLPLVGSGLLSRFATLSLPAFDVDHDTPVVPPDQPERDLVTFNGTPVKTLFRGNEAHLQGVTDTWVLNSFRIPIERVKFPSARGALGQPPTPAMNELRIDIDTANEQELWCTAIDWAGLSIKIMSPIILVHGNNSDGDFFVRQGFTAGLDSQFLLWDNSINMITAPVAAHAGILDLRIPNIVTSFGVDSVHLVAHSKGGLDSRDYLVDYHPQHERDFDVLSLTTLSTPHNGSVLADVAMTRHAAARRAADIDFAGFPTAAGFLTALAGVDAGLPNLTTGWTASFNAENIGLLPDDTVYNAVAADADLNGNARIDSTPDEFAELRTESTQLTVLNVVGASRAIVDLMYQILRNTRSVDLEYARKTLGSTEATLTAVPSPGPLGNDTLVTLPSGTGEGSFATRATTLLTFTGGLGRNHASVADDAMAGTVGPLLIGVERDRGDLR